MRKSLKVIDNKPPVKSEDMELLVSHNKPRTSGGSSLGSRVKLYIGLLAFGLMGTIVCLWTMLDTNDSKATIQSLGMHKVANSLENILALLAYPILMFTVILSAYAGQQLFRLYKIANDPEFYRSRRSR